MDENIKARLDAYVEIFENLKEKTKNSNEALVLLTEAAKDSRMEKVKQRQANNGSPATDRQKKFMKNLGIDFPENVTKREASALIDEELGKSG